MTTLYLPNAGADVKLYKWDHHSKRLLKGNTGTEEAFIICGIWNDIFITQSLMWVF